MSAPVVVVYPTIQDGTVVRWYGNVAAAMAGSEMASASRNKVYADGARLDVILAAWSAHEALRADHNADMSHLATHRRLSIGSRELVRLDRPATDARRGVAIVDLPNALVNKIASGLWGLCGIDEGPAEDAVMHVAAELLRAGWVDPTGASHV